MMWVISQFNSPLFVPIEQVDEAMIEAGDKNCDFRTVAVQHQMILDPICVGDRPEMRLKVGRLQVESVKVPFHTSQKELESAVDMVVGMQHTAIMRYEELCDGSNDSFAGELHGTAGEQDGGFLIYLNLFRDEGRRACRSNRV